MRQLPFGGYISHNQLLVLNILKTSHIRGVFFPSIVFNRHNQMQAQVAPHLE